MSILWITLAVLAGAFIVGGTAIYFLRARFIENLQADPSNIASVAAPVTVAEEVRSIGDQIEKAMAEQRLQGETQRQLLAQKLDTVRHTLDDQKQQVGGLRNELRHEIKRRDAEMTDIRHQISNIQTTIALPPASAPQAALPPASVPAPADEPPAPESAFEDMQFPIEAPAAPVPAASVPEPASDVPPAPEAEADDGSTIFEEPTFEEPTFDVEIDDLGFEEMGFEDLQPTAPAEPTAELLETPADAFSFEIMPADAFSPSVPTPEATTAPDPVVEPEAIVQPEAAPKPEAAFEPTATPSPFMTDDAFADEPETFEPISFEVPAPDPMDDTPTFEAVAFSVPSEDFEGDSVADIAFSDVDFEPIRPMSSAPSTDAAPATTPAPTTPSVTPSVTPTPPPTFESWTPEAVAPDADAPVPFSPSDLLSMPSEDHEETPTMAPPAQAPQPETWIARSNRPEVQEIDDAFDVPQPIVASMDDFLPSPTSSPAPEAESAMPETAVVPAEPAPVPQAVVVEPTIIEPLGEEPTSASETAAETDTEAEPKAAVPNGADDLTVISSIDEITQNLLYAEGVMTLDEIARWGRGEARRIASAVQVSEETIMNQWVFEAQAALFDQFTQQG